jgi:predicted ArsR family transcriptional regulator
MEDTNERAGQLASLCSLDDSTRAALYEYVAEQDEPVSRDQAAAAVGVERSVAAYHLDRLVEEGLLTTSFARPEGRGGPGAGRPAKHYQPSDTELLASAPPRDYRLAAELLTRAVAADGSGEVRTTLERVARELGARSVADSAAAGIEDALRRLGYRPYRDRQVIRLRNCPFHRLAQAHTEVICGMNLALMTGLADALDEAVEPRLDPALGRCCVAFHMPAD